ncbi:aa3-type cytochrome oxidase subunit II [Nocardioides coralli]|uniref:aa3-type cytochrome oxidase subunit II n=1 Tax=Nocardioides coralli TaxID=2872154 RepID=UPI001CA41148|nr:cytochrome c oxidase subunit II [Nocardioides coralli]QZY28040.1 cytochrome c oxidase subunit II [Nocardioides coralli]
MGQQLQRRPAALRRVAVVFGLGALVFLGGCSAQTQQEWRNLAMPDPATEQADHIFYLWRYAWIAALATGVVVWGLIGWVVVRYRRKHADEVPVQTRYNLPLEIFYTVAPIIMVIVFFYHTVNVQNAVLDDTEQDHTIEVVGQQWSWTFNYRLDGSEDGPVVYTVGAGGNIPTLVLPVGETTQFNLHSPDVIHSFGVPGFLMKMDVIPGRVNSYEVTPDTEGTFLGKCYELCGTYHSRMLFEVEVVSPEEFEEHLQELENQGNTSDEPLLGGDYVREQAGLDDEEEAE